MTNYTLVVPCYNEAARLKPELFFEAVDLDPRMNLLFVDDGSIDETWSVLRRTVEQQPSRIRAYQLKKNSGKAEAVRQGLLQALDATELVGFWDADLATPLDEASRFADVFEGEPTLVAVLGSRVQMLGRQIERGVSRHLAGRAMASLISLTLSLPTYDTQCGAKLFRVTESLTSSLQEPFISRWVFDVELLARLREQIGRAALHEQVREVPVTIWRDVAGSKVHLMDGVRAVRDLRKIRRRFPHPS